MKDDYWEEMQAALEVNIHGLLYHQNQILKKVSLWALSFPISLYTLLKHICQSCYVWLCIFLFSLDLSHWFSTSLSYGAVIVMNWVILSVSPVCVSQEDFIPSLFPTTITTTPSSPHSLPYCSCSLYLLLPVLFLSPSDSLCLHYFPSFWKYS